MMTHRDIYLRIRIAVFGAGLCLAILYATIFLYAQEYFPLIAEQKDDERRIMWLLLIFGTAIPVIIALVKGWRISDCVRRDKSFSSETARLLGGISNCAFGDAGYFLLGNLLMFIFDCQRPGLFLTSAAAIILALAAGMGFAALARFVQKAADLQEESDLTV